MAVLIVVTFALFSTIVFAILHFAGPVEDVETKRAAERFAFLHKVRSRDAEALNSYSPADPATGRIRIPVNRAAELAVERLAAKPIRAADLVAPPASSLPATNAPAPAADPSAQPPKA
ncbi:MAG: hypothetical protein IT578_04730 [Verrucomicrobiae bacterium]|nr:hypothetical protein [Verrucomicrobiae bacterium]